METMLKGWMRKLPPIAWRDEKIQEWKTRHDKLRTKLESSPQAPAWRSPGREAATRLVEESRLWDEAWYRSQLRTDQPQDAIAHFLDEGQAQGLSPHPVFVPSYYLSQLPESHRGRKPVLAAPFLHYLSVGAAKGWSPHPLFDAAAYRAAYPGSAKAPGGPVAVFLARGAALTREAGATGAPWDLPQALQDQALATAELLRDTRGFSDIDRDVSHFDLELEARTKQKLLRHPLPEELPVVSVVIPTKDRAEMLPETLDSVLAQTYPHWQLIVVDDGSRDGTQELLARYADDDRVVLLRHDQARGVAAARNTALAAATGTYVAYLDSDNTWFPDFLELMVRHLLHTGRRVAYGVTALVEEGGQGRRLYRYVPHDLEHLRERNYIDCIVLVHERSLLEQSGTFDETLRRNVDWDLFLRLAEHSDFSLVPVRATQYDVWTEQGERITTLEPMAYRYVVRQRAMVDLPALADAVDERDPELLSVVMVVGETTPPAQVLSGILRLRESATGPLEVVVVDSRTAPEVFTTLHPALSQLEGVTVVRLTQPLPMEVARNVGVGSTTGRVLCFLPPGLWAQPGWDADLRAGLDRHSVVQPLVLTPGGSVWSAGIDHLPTGHAYHRWLGFPGDAGEVRQEAVVGAVGSGVLAVSAADFLRAGGFDPLIRDDYHGAELSLRVTGTTGGGAAVLPGSVFAWRETPPESRSASALLKRRENARLDRDRWEAVGSPARPPETALPGYRLAGFERARNTVPVPQPIFVHDRPDRPLRWAIKIGAPTVERRTNWGDWHFAESLRDALERLGHEVAIDCKEDWYRPTAHLDDVVLQLRGVSIYEVNPGHTNISWVISHPDRVTSAELAEYDLVFGASPRWCRTMSARLGSPVEPLIQCTDHHRFHPVTPDPRRSHEVLAVANARGVRPSVAAALAAGVVPSVYGLRWGGLLPDGAWKGEYIPNAELPAVYCGAGVVLNDHWDDMRDLGILSNRLFDLAACEARVISDHLPEIERVFGDTVLTFGEGQEMGDLLRQQLHETPERAEARRELGARVRTEHTFDARARQLSDAVSRLRARSGGQIAVTR